MDISEIKEMINSTITTNNTGGITGRALNLALNAIVNSIESGVGSGGSNNTLVIIPSETDWNNGNSNSTLLENNVNCYGKLQANPNLPVCLQKLNEERPFAYNAACTTEVYSGRVVICELKPNVSEQSVTFEIQNRYELKNDGSVTKLNPDGTEVIMWSDLIGIYDVTYTSTPTQSINQIQRVAEIYYDNGLKIRNPLGSFTSVVDMELSSNKLTMYTDKHTSTNFGPFSQNMTFTISHNNGNLVLTAQEQPYVGSWITITSWTLTKKD